MRVNLRRRIAFVAALIVPAVVALTLGAAPALAALPRYGRLVLGSQHTVSPLAILIVAVGTGVGLALLLISARRRSDVPAAAVSTLPVEARPPADSAGRRRAA